MSSRVTPQRDEFRGDQRSIVRAEMCAAWLAIEKVDNFCMDDTGARNYDIVSISTLFLFSFY